MAFSLLVFLCSLYVLVPLIGNHGVWTAVAIMMVTRAATLAWMMPGLVEAIPDNEPSPANIP